MLHQGYHKMQYFQFKNITNSNHYWIIKHNGYKHLPLDNACDGIISANLSEGQKGKNY